MQKSPSLKARFAEPPFDDVDLLIIAGEHSGDEHAADLLKQVLEQRPNLKVAAIGGEELERAGAHLLFNPLENAVVGLVEVIKHFDYLRALFDGTLDWIERYRPRVVCFVDYPGFNLRIAKRLFNRGISSKAGGNVRLIYYISPQIWAWKSKRRFAMAKHLDSLGTIFPFEVACYDDTELPVQFVGHPFVAEDRELTVSYDPHGKILLLPGSRTAVVGRIFPVLVETFYRLRKSSPELEAMVMYPTEKIRKQLEAIVVDQGGSLDDFEMLPNSDRFSARAVITNSGTISLVCALAAIPGLLVYKTNSLTYLMAKFLVKIRSIGIANIILDEFIYPEYLQGDMRADILEEKLSKMIHDSSEITRVRDQSARLHERLKVHTAQNARQWVFQQLDLNPKDC
jgi:lipid-A-disaccharide synthase